MQAVDLNLASRPFKNDTMLWLVLLLAVGLVGYASWWNVHKWGQHRELVAKLKDSQASLAQRFDQLERRDRQALESIDGYNLSVILVKADKANELIRWKAFSWTELFNQLQEVLPGAVQMSSIRPVFEADQRKRDAIEDPALVPVAVEGVAKTLRDFMEFERNLIADPHFSRPEPDRWTTDENSNETVFRLRFLYDPRVGNAADLPEAELLADDQEDGPGPSEPAEAIQAVVDASAATGAETADEVALPEPVDELATRRLGKIERGSGASSPPPSDNPVPEAHEDEVRTPGPAWGTRPGDAKQDSDEVEGGQR